MSSVRDVIIDDQSDDGIAWPVAAVVDVFSAAD
jgi:hypothetical protein